MRVNERPQKPIRLDTLDVDDGPMSLRIGAHRNKLCVTVHKLRSDEDDSWWEIVFQETMSVGELADLITRKL